MNRYSVSVSKNYSKYELINQFFTRDLIEASDETKRKLLELFGFDLTTIDLDDSQITIRLSEDEPLSKQMPTISITKYDENNNICKKFSKLPSDNNVISFKGEIYENLKFHNQNMLDSFIKKNGYENYIYEDTTSLIHFEVKEINERKKIDFLRMQEQTLKQYDGLIPRVIGSIIEREKKGIIDVSELYITKNKSYYTIFINSPYYYNNIDNNSNFNSAEIENILTMLSTIGNEFLPLYARASLKVYQDSIINREYKPSQEFIDSKSLSLLERCILYPASDDTITVKLKVISNNEVKFNDNIEKEKVFTLK